MNYLFTVKHRKTERDVAVYATMTFYRATYFLIWNKNKNEFEWRRTLEFERIESSTDTDYVEE